mgnify:CR=1 FL=1
MHNLILLCAIGFSYAIGINRGYRRGRVDGERAAIDRAERAARKESQL